jgi:hypothetical protein
VNEAHEHVVELETPVEASGDGGKGEMLATPVYAAVHDDLLDPIEEIVP